MLDLSALYILLFKDNTITTEQKKQIMNEVCSLINMKYTSKEIIDFFLLNFKNRTHVNVIDCKRRTCMGANLLNPKEMYYHKELRIIQKPNVVASDYNAGVMVGHQEEYFLEIVASYTLDNLTDYFLSKEIVNSVEYTRPRLNGFFRHYITKYGLDVVLFTIEAITHNIELKNCFSMNNFENYYVLGKTYYENCKSNCIENDGNKVIPRKRKLFDDGR